jgi:hypothetical protein
MKFPLYTHINLPNSQVSTVIGTAYPLQKYTDIPYREV